MNRPFIDIHCHLQPPAKCSGAIAHLSQGSAICIVALAFTGWCHAQTGTPYPASPIIDTIQWAEPDSVIRQAAGGDNWPLTWAADDALYSTYGDGWGFEPKVPEKLSLGLVRITGGPTDFHGTNLRSPSIEKRGAGRKGEKAWGMLAVESRLLMWQGHADHNGAESQLAWSRDAGLTWQHAEWRFKEFGLIGFVNFGCDYAGARDNHVYAYSHDGPAADAPANHFVLMRAAKELVTERSAWEFFVRQDENGDAVWTSDVTQRGAVFTNPDRCLRSAMTYNPGIKRYLWWQAIPQPPGHPDRGDTRYEGGFAIYDAPQPWGPWTTAYSTERWDIGPGEHGDFPTKWISPDGCDLYLVFSGDDCFSVRKATIQLR